MRNRILTLLLLSVIAYGCGSTGAIEETVILNSKEPVGDNYIPKKLYKKPSDIEGIDSIVNSKKNPFQTGPDLSKAQDSTETSTMPQELKN